jgi:hypothetical protein
LVNGKFSGLTPLTLPGGSSVFNNAVQGKGGPELEKNAAPGEHGLTNTSVHCREQADNASGMPRSV